MWIGQCIFRIRCVPFPFPPLLQPSPATFSPTHPHHLTPTPQAIDPPGEAKSDLAIFADYASRMDFRDKHGNPLVHWGDDPEGAFEVWKRSTRGRPCDYTGLSYKKLTGAGLMTLWWAFHRR